MSVSWLSQAKSFGDDHISNIFMSTLCGKEEAQLEHDKRQGGHLRPVTF